MLALAALSSAAAMTWWIEDPHDAAILEDALVALWPEESATITLGPPPPDALGVRLQDETLVWASTDGLRQQPGIADWSTAVVLVRSWSERITPPPPPEPEPVAVEAPPPVLPPEPSGIAAHVAVFAGPATRRPDPSPAYHFALQGGIGETWSAVILAEFDPSERVPFRMDDDEDVWLVNDGVMVVRRAGALAGVGRSLPLRQSTLEVAVAGGVRWHHYFTINSIDERSSTLLPTASARVRLWNAAPPRIGVGVMASLDGLGGGYYPGLSVTAPIRHQTVAVEVGGRFFLAAAHSE